MNKTIYKLLSFLILFGALGILGCSNKNETSPNSNNSLSSSNLYNGTSSNTNNTSSSTNNNLSSNITTSNSSETSTITPSENLEASKVSINGYSINIEDKIDGAWLNKRPYIIKGVCWSPTDKGNNNNPNFIGRVSQDAKLMQEANINTVRTYSFLSANADGLKILDTLVHYGIRIIMVNAWGGTSEAKLIEKINFFKDHPAILAWQIGNEYNYNNFYYFDDLATSNTYAQQQLDAAKANDPNHPVILGWGHPLSNEGYTATNKFDYDILAVQVYSGESFGDLFKTHKTSSTKPLFISEYGADSYNHNINSEDWASQAYANAKLTEEIRDNLATNTNGQASGEGVTIGGTIFEWNDEWWKAGNVDQQDVKGTAPGDGPYPDATFDEEFWGILTIDREKKDTFKALKAVFATY